MVSSYLGILCSYAKCSHHKNSLLKMWKIQKDAKKKIKLPSRQRQPLLTFWRMSFHSVWYFFMCGPSCESVYLTQLKAYQMYEFGYCFPPLILFWGVFPYLYIFTKRFNESISNLWIWILLFPLNLISRYFPISIHVYKEV